MPTDLDAPLAATAELVARRVEMDDEAETPRPVDHLVRTPRSSADALVAELEAAGFEVQDRRSRIKVSVQFTRTDAVDAATAAAFTREVVQIAARHGADYDGWGAMVLPRGRQQYAVPADAVPLADVDADAEQGRLGAAQGDRPHGPLLPLPGGRDPGGDGAGHGLGQPQPPQAPLALCR
jgi:hypothetical protein